jgi:phosphocarrier protein HPr
MVGFASMTSRRCVIRNPSGLHARPAGKFAQAATAHAGAIRVCKGEKVANGKSILALLTLGAKCQDTVTLEIEGDDEALLMRLEKILTHSNEHDEGATPKATDSA